MTISICLGSSHASHSVSVTMCPSVAEHKAHLPGRRHTQPIRGLGEQRETTHAAGSGAATGSASSLFPRLFLHLPLFVRFGLLLGIIDYLLVPNFVSEDHTRELRHGLYRLCPVLLDFWKLLAKISDYLCDICFIWIT